MSQSSSSNPRTALAVALALVLASLVLAACGSSSTSSTASTNASATTATTTGSSVKARGARFTAIRECMQKAGITLPKRTQGQRPPAGGGFQAGGAPQLPKGVTAAQYQAAIKKCGGFPRGGGRFGGPISRINSPVFKQALARFAKCLGENGVKVPAPNTSGKGPIFNTQGLNVNSPKFKAAQTKCAGVLRNTFRAAPGAAGAGPAAGAPPTPGG
jgi:hypothetical protein